MASTTGGNAPAGSAPPKKKSLFNFDALEESTAADEAVDFFSRAKELRPTMLAREEEKRQKRLLKQDRKRSTASAESKEVSPPVEKKRRVSGQSAKHDGYSSNEHDEAEHNSYTRRQTTPPSPEFSRSPRASELRTTQISPNTRSGRHKPAVKPIRGNSQKPKAASNSVTLSDSDEEAPRAILPVRKAGNEPIALSDSDDQFPSPRKPARIIEEDEMVSDEEYPELVAKAKERAKQKAEDAAKAAKALEEKKHLSNGKGTGIIDDAFEIDAVNLDPKIEILVSSRIEDTTPLRVGRRISQKLLEVKHAWSDRQTINGIHGPELREKIFLTWGKLRVFDYSSCKGLGLEVDEYGNLVSKGGKIDPEGRVSLEAWTEEAYAAWQKQEEEKNGGVEVEQREPPVKKARLVLKSKDYPDFKMVVKPGTTIERIIEAFGDANKLPEGKILTLHYDGDKLDEGDTVADTELEDMDTVEVHIR